MAYLGTWPLIPAFVAIVGGFVFVSIVGVRFAQRRLPQDVLTAHNDVNGFVFSVVGIVYAVLLGLIAIGVWARFDAAEVRTYDEAGNLTEIYRDADIFPQRAWLRTQIRKYTLAIVADDWPAMSLGEQDTRTRVEVESIAATVRRLSVRTPAETNAQYQMLNAFQLALSDRDARMSLEATGLNPVMWTVLLLGAALSIGFTWLFGFRHPRMRGWTIGIFAAMLGLVLFLVTSLDHPFRGGVRLKPEAFDHALQSYMLIDRIERTTPR